MKRILNLLLVSAIVATMATLSGCKKSNKDDGDNNLRKAKGGRFYGGVFKINESEFIKTLFPHNIVDVISTRVASQIYEGLFKFDPSDLSIKKSLIEDYTVDSSGTVYTFKLKKGVVFHNDPCFSGGKGRQLTSQDVKYCFTLLCTQHANNQGFGTVFKDVLKGANEYYSASAGGKTPSKEVEGIKIIDDFTFELVLNKPSSVFMFKLAMPFTFIFPKEAYEKYGLEMRTKAIGTGPFMLQNIDDDISIILKKNDNYHNKDEFGNKLPFLDAVDIHFLRDKKTELFEFKKGNFSMIYHLPTEYIIEILEETGSNENGEYGQYELQRKPEMSTLFLSFLNTGPLFKNKNLRKAFSFAIDREKILEYVLNGEGFAPGFHGVNPPSFSNYPIDSVRGYTLNLDSAKYYLNKAGYPSGKGFPEIVLQLASDGDRKSNVAIEVQKQLKENLNVNLKLEIIPNSTLAENMIGGKTNFYFTGWGADFPSPENFLALFYGKDVPTGANTKSYPNFARYKNATFDKLYEEALVAKSVEEANKKFLKAEQILMADAPIIVLWYDEGYRLVQNYIKNFPNNPMQFRDYSEVYIEKGKKVKEK
jgi:peptide/nickel transport system substrate-binding protein